MKIYVKDPNVLYEFLPKSGKTDYDSLRFAFTFLEKGDYMLNNDGEIFEILDPGPLYPGFLESSRVVEVKKIDYNELPEEVKKAIRRLAKDYPPSETSERCRKVLENIEPHHRFYGWDFFILDGENWNKIIKKGVVIQWEH